MKGSIMELLQPHLLLFMGKGLLVTLQIAVTSILLSFVFGTVIGVMRYSRHKVLAPIAGFYVEAVRNSPLLLLILFARFASGLKPVNSGIAAMTVFTTAVLAEVVRGGLNSIDKGQWEAAKSQGFSYFKTLRYIVLPQALRRMIPPMFSQFITVIKDTSYVWVVGVEELTGKGMIIMGQYGSTSQFFAIFLFIAFVYYVLCHLLGRMARALERRSILQTY
ncbi:MAG TPA: amino acid ABC transporter permease [Symbiobacteriaceae bacterium]|jgi:putative glutamine transport system permease protein